MKKTVFKLVATAGIAFAFNSASFGQTNLGADCGCPTPVSTRPTVLVSTLATSGGAGDGELLANNTIFDCAHTWILDKKIYVPNGKTLTIMPGTVIKGNPGVAANATCLLVEVGGKIFASGSPTCQIVFTAAADNLDGTFPIASNGQWGGVLIAGKATNNLTLAANGPFQPGVGDGKLCVADGIGTFEGFASTNSKDQFGVTPAQFDDNDNSGILKYVSIRYAGAILQVGGEINALSLGSVGRGTTIEHLEIISSADDGIEFWGGTVNIKYYANLFGNDDNFDWDDGYSGKVQFVFSLKTDNSANTANDNGFECDADDQKSNNTPRSHPIIYNATMVGNNKTHLNYVSDESGPAGIMAKELTEGEIYNSVIANYEYGCEIKKALVTGRTQQVYDNWQAGTFVVKCNTFVNCTNPLTIDKAAPLAADLTKFNTTDMNTSVGSVAGFDYTFTVNNNTNIVSHKTDLIPNPALSIAGCPTPPADGFYSVANYRGAFAPTGQTWLSPWAYSVVAAAVGGSVLCPTDINNDGVTNNVDFLQLLGQFNQSCQ